MDQRARHKPRRFDLGRTFARIVVGLLALIGAAPFVAALLISSGPLQGWAEEEAARVLREELGLSARYRARLRLLPLRLSVEDLVVPASDGGSPAFTAESVGVAPRVFALFGGRLDLGEIDISRPHARLVVKDGKIRNLSYRLPEDRTPSRSQRAPFTSLSITEGRFRVQVDDVGIETGVDPKHANCIYPGKRPFHTIIPAMMTKDDRPLVSFGVMGGDMQAQGHVQVVSRLVDEGCNIQEAIDAARFHYLAADRVALEEELREIAGDELARLGHTVEDENAALARGGFGGGQGIMVDPSSAAYWGGSDRRKDGCAIGF
jgi:hypothetical protein